MGINPETYAPPHSSPLSSSSAAASSAAISPSSTTSFSAARHMAQWESARLEAEARLSRQSLLFSAAAAANSTFPTAETANQTATNQEEQKKEPVDVFLRMWSSNIGETFRSSKVKKEKREEEEEEFSPAVSSSCNTKQSCSAMTVSEVNNDNVEAEEDTSDETFQFYLDLAAGDELSLFQNQNHHDHHQLCYSWFGNDLNEEAASDPLHDHNDPFK